MRIIRYNVEVDVSLDVLPMHATEEAFSYGSRQVWVPSHLLLRLLLRPGWQDDERYLMVPPLHGATSVPGRFLDLAVRPLEPVAFEIVHRKQLCKSTAVSWKSAIYLLCWKRRLQL